LEDENQGKYFYRFFGAGKTSLINEMLRSPLFQKEKILVLQCESEKKRFVLSFCLGQSPGGKAE
jgi:hypothetical protein